ncbi:MAG: N-acetylmuramic acid 6-phosphate etherase [Actinomycetes bacterium]
MIGEGHAPAVVRAPTERRNPATLDIDRLDTLGVLECVNDADQDVPAAVRAALPELARVVDAAVEALRRGGQVHYVGAGTSGRLGMLDAAELPPTYAIEPGRFVAHNAGGLTALASAVEGVEDDEALGAADVRDVGADDVVVGLTASGRTPYVRGALRAARAAGARTALVSSNPDAPLVGDADVHVCLDTGPEVIAGSTRMKAGTAQKLVLHSLSTAVMIRLGRTYSNLMVSMAATNGKLRGRMLRILAEATGLDDERCARVLQEADGEVKTALVALLADVPVGAARGALADTGDVVRDALSCLRSPGQRPSGSTDPEERG